MMMNGPVNTDALLYEVQADSVRDGHVASRSDDSLLSKSFRRMRVLRTERLKSLDALLIASGAKNILKARFNDLNARQLVEKTSHAIKTLVAKMKSASSFDELTRQRLLALLHDIDEERDRIHTDKIQNTPLMLNGENQAAAKNISTAITNAHDFDKLHMIENSNRGQQIQTAFDEQKGAIQTTLSALKKSGILGKIFKFVTAIVMPIIATAVGVIVPAFGIASFVLRTLISGLLQNAANGLLQTSQYFAQRPVTRQLSRAQNSEQNAISHSQVLSRREIEESAENQRSVSLQQNLIRQLEESAGNQ